MLTRISKLAALALAICSASQVIAANASPKLTERGIPADPKGVKTITSPAGARIRYKQPGKEGICETTPGVNSYSGYVDLDETTHMFFQFFEARKNPGTAPLTLWLNGGPGSDSLIGLYQELGPCNVTKDLKTQLNPYAWNEVSNMLFLSQPVGVGFSYGTEEVGSLDPDTGLFRNTSVAPADGRYSLIDPYKVDTTDLAAIGTWHILQAFLSELPQLDSRVKSKTFNLWTESYGGHYGPAFYKYFYDQNKLIAAGKTNGTVLNMDSLGIINGIIDQAIQIPYYPEFAVNNTYGIKAVNDTIYNFMKTAAFIPGGCLDYLAYCASLDRSTIDGQSNCASATNICRSLVEGPYYTYSGRGVYDIRHPYKDPTPPKYYIDYLNTAKIQNALGVNLNYTTPSSPLVFQGFSDTGDFAYPTYIKDLEYLLSLDVRVALLYGDADYICNWFGGEAVSLAVNYTHTKEFNAAGYTPFLVDGVEYGEVRQYGNFSFTRLYEAGHEVPYYQPKASLSMFERVLNNKVLADGKERLTGTYGSKGGAKATHTEPFVPVPTTTSAAGSASASASAFRG